MGTTMKVYDADQITILIGAILVDSGFADGEFCRVEQDEDDFKKVVGTDGSVTRSKTNNRTARITIILNQTSESNQAFTALRTLDISTPNGAGIVPVLIKDRQGNTVFEAEHGWIAKAPDVSFDRVSTNREWVFDTGRLDRNDAGN